MAVGHRRDHEWLETFEGEGADRYDAHVRSLRGMHERAARRVVDLLPQGGRYVDVGAGPGTMLAQVAALRPDVTVTGVDPSQRMVELASGRLSEVGARARVLQGSAESLPLPDASADVVSAVVTMHHWQDLDAGVAEVMRALAPGGSVLVIEMHGPARHVARALRRAGAIVVREIAWVYGLPLLARLTARRPEEAASSA